MSSSGVKQCALCPSSKHDVHHAIVGVNVVIGVLVVHCELLVVRVVPLVVCDDAVVRRTLVLIAVAVGFVFVVAFFHRFLLYWKYIVYSLSVSMEGWGRGSRGRRRVLKQTTIFNVSFHLRAIFQKSLENLMILPAALSGRFLF